MSHVCRTLVLVVLASGLALSQEKGGAEAWGTHLGPAAPCTPPRHVEWDEQRELALGHEGWQQFRAEHAGWTALFDVRSGHPERAFGPGRPVLPAGPERAEVAAVAMQLRDELVPLIGGNPETHELRSVVRSGPMWYVHFVQKLGAFRVWDAGLTLRIDDRGRLVMWGGRVVDTAHLDPVPNLGAQAAQQQALAHLTAEGFVWPDTEITLHGIEPVVHVRQSRTDFTPTVTWLVKLAAETPHGNWLVFVDAHDGGIADYWNDIRECHGHHSEAAEGCAACDDHASTPALDPALVDAWLASITGTLTGTTHDGLLPHQAPMTSNFPGIHVFVNGSQITTDAVGGFTYNGGGTTVPITSQLDGPWLNGSASTGISANYSGSASTGTAVVHFDDTNSSIGQRDMVFFANRAHDVLKQHAPNQTLLDNQMAGRANLTTGNCNAYYEPFQHRINFYVAGGGCVNSATSGTVVEHEYGHGITDRIYGNAGQSVPGHLGEGYSDCIAGACEDSSLTGAGFSGIGTVIRNMANTCQYPASCGSQIHARGLVIGGCYWSTRLLFASAMGQAGKDLMDDYLFQHFSAAPQDETVSVLEMLLLDDDDGNLANGTPNVLTFHQGFTVAHGVPFPLDLVQIIHDPLNDSLDQLQDYQVWADIGTIAGSNVSGAAVLWRPGSGTWQSLPMSNVSGGTWTVSIPVQAPGTPVNYYIQATDNLGNIGRSPKAAPAPFHAFDTANIVDFVSDGFETPSGWTHAQLLVQDDWHNIPHGNPGHTYDPAAAFQGNLTWGNDLVPASNWDGDYKADVNNYLQSPVFDCSGRSGVRLIYRRWLTVEDAFYDQARILVSANNGPFLQVWQNAVGSGTQHHIDTGWVEHGVDISAYADGQPNVRLRFQLISDGGLQFGGWNIDDLRLAASTGAPILSSSGSTTQGQLWSLHVTGEPGTPYFAVVDVAPPAPSFLPGVGTLSANPLSPSLLVLQGLGLLPPQIAPSGQDTLSFTLPSSPPQILGLPFTFQALLVPGFDPAAAVISNVETLVIQ